MTIDEQITSIETREQRYRRLKFNDMYIEREIILSEAFKKLSATAIRVYLIFLAKRVMKPFQGSKAKCSGKGKYFIENNGEIQFTYKEAEQKYGVSPGAFRTAIGQLVGAGLIDITQPGSGLHKDVSLYGISERWKLYGTDDFVVSTRVKRRQSYGFTRGNRLGRNAGERK